jgi:V-type H+-transporting ATPase subunit E
MSAEKIIKQIQKDAKSEIDQITKNTEKISKQIISDAKAQAKEEAELIVQKAKSEAENKKKILISQANQDAKKQIMQEKEKIIDDCFVKAHHKLSTLSSDRYTRIIRDLMLEGIKKLGKNSTVIVCKDIDRKIAKDLNLEVSGITESCGGIIIVSSNGKITLDNTFDGILKREKDKIRIKVGKLLFS